MSIDNGDLLVSIVCNTYNQETYIADALDSFIMQKTSFKFEILVHDDASTDSTADIVREYEKKYPDLIKPIYQTENQYSQKNGVISKLQYGRAKGKYIAFCEGDDYWIDENKLQKQVDFMESHPDYSLCVHSAQMVEADNKRLIRNISAFEEDRDMTVDEIIVRWGTELATNSMMYQRELRKEYPEFLLNAPVGDYPLTMYLSFCGKVRYMKDCMSAYRYMSRGSWSSQFMSNSEASKRKRIDLLEEFKGILDKTDNYTNYKYHQAFEEKRIIYNLEIMRHSKQLGEKKIFKSAYRQLPVKNKIIYQLENYAPFIIKLYDKIREGLNG